MTAKTTTYRHRLPVQLRFNDIDMFGHLNNTVYVQLLDQGKYEYFRQFMNGPFGSTPTAPVIANINVDYLEPAHMDDKLTVATAVTAIADTSMTLQQVIEDDKSNVKCRAKTVMVNIDLRKGVPVTVDGRWRKIIGDYENGEPGIQKYYDKI